MLKKLILLQKKEFFKMFYVMHFESMYNRYQFYFIALQIFMNFNFFLGLYLFIWNTKKD